MAQKPKKATTKKQSKQSKQPSKKAQSTKKTPEAVKVDHQKEIQSLLKEYNGLEKKSVALGKKIRKALRRRGYYLSKENED